MESLQLKSDLRNSLYFGKFKYKAVLNIRNVWITRYVEYWNRDSIENMLEKGFTRTKAENTKQLTDFARWRSSVCQLLNKSECRYNTSTHQFIMYSNNLELLQSGTVYGSTSVIFEAKSIDPKTENLVMYFKRPPAFKYRTYLNFTRFGKEYEEILSYFQSLQNTLVKEGKISFCPSIKKAIIRDFGLCGKSNFVDHNDPGFITILRLMYPRYVYRMFELRLTPIVDEKKSLQLPFE